MLSVIHINIHVLYHLWTLPLHLVDILFPGDLSICQIWVDDNRIVMGLAVPVIIVYRCQSPFEGVSYTVLYGSSNLQMIFPVFQGRVR
jgi:hypothetical protein